jgi:hypothetical protein
MGRLSFVMVLTLGVGASALGAGGAHAQPSAVAAPAKATPAKGAPAVVADDWTKHVSLTAEIGPGGVLADYTPNPGPNTLLLLTGLHVNYDFTPEWVGSLVLRQWWLPNDDHALMFGPGARYELLELWSGQVYADGALGLVSTRRNWTVGLDVGGGIDWEIPDAPGVSIGPFLRIGYVSNPNEGSDADGAAWSLGGAVTYHFGRASEAVAAHAPRKRGPYKITITDTDRDGIGDDRDECPNEPQGKYPDQFRVGCPEGDSDGDGLPDSEDLCPAQEPGDTPDPKRAGCPLIDSDKDGIPDAEDACPNKAGSARPNDPANHGCPMKKEGGGAKAAPEDDKPAETPEGLVPIKTRKRKMK